MLVQLMILALVDCGVMLGILAMLQGPKLLPSFSLTVVIALALAICNQFSVLGFVLLFGIGGMALAIPFALLVNGVTFKLAFGLTAREALYMTGLIFVYWVVRSPLAGPVSW